MFSGGSGKLDLLFEKPVYPDFFPLSAKIEKYVDVDWKS
jgi:hypothetical protein